MDWIFGPGERDRVFVYPDNYSLFHDVSESIDQIMKRIIMVKLNENGNVNRMNLYCPEKTINLCHGDKRVGGY